MDYEYFREHQQINSIKDIWIESEVKGVIIKSELYTNDNTDAIVTFDNDKKYIATFFTYHNTIPRIKKSKNRRMQFRLLFLGF